MSDDTPTPAQVAYETFVRVGYPEMEEHVDALLWQSLRPDLKRAWEAAAQAVLARPQTQGEAIVAQINAREAASLEALRREMEEEEPRFQFAMGSHVRRTSDPEHLWEIWYRTCREEVGRTFIDYGLRLVDPDADYHPCRFSDGSELVPAEEAPHG